MYSLKESRDKGEQDLKNGQDQKDLAAETIVKFMPTGQSGLNIATSSGFTTAVE